MSDPGFIAKTPGPPYGFKAAKFREKIRFVMNMAMPTPASEQLAFCWDPTVTSSGALDSTKIPFDPAATVTKVPVAVVRRPYVTEFIDAVGEPTPFGVVVPSRVRVWLLDEDYEAVKTCHYITIDGERYNRHIQPPSYALFEVGVHCLAFQAVNER